MWIDKIPCITRKDRMGFTSYNVLGFLIDTINRLVCIRVNKVVKAKQLILKITGSKKTMAKSVQQLCRYLNFICHAVVPGRTFTRRIYSLMVGKYKNLKQHHHVTLTTEIKNDLRLWLKFLDNPLAVCRPFVDFSETTKYSHELFYTDASKNADLGCSGWCHRSWFVFKWDKQFIQLKDPSIAYLELYGIAIAIMLWLDRFKNARTVINCDNQSVVHMINNASSNCRNCMVLLCLIVMESLVHNVRVQAKFVDTKSNDIADSILRFKWERFEKLTKQKQIQMDELPMAIPQEIKDMSKLWID